MTRLTFAFRRQEQEEERLAQSRPDWGDFWQKFPFGDLRSSQGQYQIAAEDLLKNLPKEQQIILLDLLDLQWVAFVEQLAILNMHQLARELEGVLDTADARLQINSNLRGKFGLPARDFRKALMALPPGGLLGPVHSS